MGVEHLHDVLLLFQDKVLFEDVDGLLVDLLILDQLQLLDFINKAALFGDDHHWIGSLLSKQVFLSALQDKVNAFEGYDKRARVSGLQD